MRPPYAVYGYVLGGKSIVPWTGLNRRFKNGLKRSKSVFKKLKNRKLKKPASITMFLFI
jgi:hypothetical protein